MRTLAILAFAIILTTISNMESYSEIIAQDVEYTSGGETMQGYIAYDNSIAGKIPGVLIVHQWKGLTDYEKMRARQLAELGYFAFAVDVYGKGIRPSTPEEAAKEAGKFYGDTELLRTRLNSGLEELLKQTQADPTRIAAIGYCFGGSAVIELARSGAEIDGVVSFHGGLRPAGVEAEKKIKASLLVLHGADDPFIKSEDKLAFQKEMAEAKTDMVFVEYSGAVHSFTDKGAGNDNSRGAAYNEAADRRSWQAMKDFFLEIFSR